MLTGFLAWLMAFLPNCGGFSVVWLFFLERFAEILT